MVAIVKELGNRKAGMIPPRVDELLILNLYLFGIYTNIFIYRGESILIPNVFALMGATLMFIRRPKDYNNSLLLPLGALLLFITLFTIVGGSGWKFLPFRFTSLLQMASALISAHLALLFMTRMEVSSLRSVFFGWLLFIVIGTLFEVIGILQPASEWFRATAYSKAWLYEAPIRDLEIYGAIRPKLFTQEPSHVAKAFAAFSVAWFLLSRHRYRTAILLALTAVEVVTLRSPFVVLALPVIVAAMRLVVVEKSQAAGRVWKTAAFTTLLFLAAVIAASVLFPGRLETIQAGNDVSMYMRFVGPFITTGMVLSDHPLFGIGLGAKEYLWPYLRESYGMMGPDRYLAQIYLSLSGNGLANSLMFFGVIGSAAFWWLVWRYYRTFSLPAAAMGILLVLLFFNLEGSIEGARTWGYVTICLSGFLVARRRGLQEARARPRDLRKGKGRRPTLSNASSD